MAVVLRIKTHLSHSKVMGRSMLMTIMRDRPQLSYHKSNEVHAPHEVFPLANYIVVSILMFHVRVWSHEKE